MRLAVNRVRTPAGSARTPNHRPHGLPAGHKAHDNRPSSYLCLIDTLSGEVIEEGRLRTNPETFKRRFASEQPLRVDHESVFGAQPRLEGLSLLSRKRTYEYWRFHADHYSSSHNQL